MDDLRIGAIVRALRRRAGWRQADLAVRTQVHQTTISRIERGALAGITVGTLRDVFAALGARYEPGVLWRGGELDRLLDRRHAEIVTAAADRFVRAGWRVVPEATFAHFGERGSIDLLCGHDASRTVVVAEMKSEITSVEETARRHDAKVRLAAGIAEERFGWRPRSIGRLLIVPEDRTIRRVVERHAAVFSAAYPARSREVAEWIRSPRGALAGIWFVTAKREASARRASGGPTRVAHARGSRADPADKREALG